MVDRLNSLVNRSNLERLRGFGGIMADRNYSVRLRGFGDGLTDI